MAPRLEGAGRYMSGVQHPGWLFDIGDEILPKYMGIISETIIRIPIKPISIMECHKGVERCSHVFKNTCVEFDMFR